MSSTNIIRPCTPAFYPQTTVKQVVTSAIAGSLYFLSGVHLYRMNAGTGALQWGLLMSNPASGLSREGAPVEPDVPPAPPAGRGHRGPAPLDGLVGLAVQNGRLFVTSANRCTYAFTADSGELLWEHPTGVHNGIPTVFGDTVYVPSGTMYALATQDGSERWSYPTLDVVTSTPVIARDTVYTGTYDNAVYALDRTSGQARWIYRADGRVYVAPIVDQGVVYAGSGNDGPRIFALDADSGQLLWKRSEISDTEADVAVADGVLYTSDCTSIGKHVRTLEDCRLIGLDPHTGRVLWHYSGVSGVRFLVHGQVLYAAASSGDLYAFDTRTHRLLWQQRVRRLQAGAVSRMKLLGEELYVGFNELGRNHVASLHAIDTQTGSEDWTATVTWNVGSLDLA